MSEMNVKTIIIAVIAVGVGLAAGYLLSTMQTTNSNNVNNSTSTGSLVIGMSGNATMLSLDKGMVFTIRLDENPTTGYSWNATTTAGLTVLNSTYISGGNLPGAGGVHEWKVQAEGTGAQEFNAIYERSWETQGNETQYHLIINVA
ncbi:MAG TPA: protease inhibitor I42 family protein [Methanocellaceae archaeon]